METGASPRKTNGIDDAIISSEVGVADLICKVMGIAGSGLRKYRAFDHVFEIRRSKSCGLGLAAWQIDVACRVLQGT